MDNTNQIMDMIRKVIADSSVRDECSLSERMPRAVRKIADSASESVALNDAYGNNLVAIGKDDKVQSFTNYGFNNDTLNWLLWLALYNDSWVFKRAIDKPSQDMVRNGVTFNGNADYSKVYRSLKQHRNDFIQLLQWGALFGGSVAVLLFDNVKDKEYARPMSVSKLRTSKVIRFYVTDRWYGCAPSAETVTDMQSLDFGKPMWYDITLADGNTVRFHHDYVLRYEHRTPPKLVKLGMLQGWGYAEGAHIINELLRDDQIKSSVTSLINKALIEVVKMSGMRGIFMGTDEQSQQQAARRLEMVTWCRGTNSMTILDKDDEYIKNEFTGLSGLSDLLEKNMWLVAAAVDMQGVLYGDLGKSFVENGDAYERYDETINGRCESLLRPVYDKWFSILFKRYGIIEPLEYSFNSLLLEKREAERMSAYRDFSTLASGLLTDGVIDPSQYARAMRKYVATGIVDFYITDESIEKLEERERVQQEQMLAPNEVQEESVESDYEVE